MRLHKVIVCVSKNRCWGAQHHCERKEEIVMAFKSLLRTQTYSEHASHCESTQVTTSVRVKDKHSPHEGIYIYCQHQNKWLWTPHWNIVRSHSHCDDTKVIVNISLRLFTYSLSKNKVTQSWWEYVKSLQWYLELLWKHIDLLCGHTLPLFEHTVSSWGHNSHCEGTKIYCELYKTFL